MTEAEQKYEWIQKAIKNCGVAIDIVALSEDNQFAGMLQGQLRCFVASPYCNAKYTWHSASGSIVDRGELSYVPDNYNFVEDVIGGQMELQL